MKVLFTDYDMLDVSLERQIFREAGIELIEAQCRTEDEVVARAGGCSALLIQYAPVAERVFAAHPGIGLCSRIGAGFDTIDTAAAARHGVWVANSPDYGVGEVSTHALAMMLSVIRGIARYDRDIHNGQWHYTTVGRIPRASNLTVGVLGLGRIGKRFAHIARNTFKRVIAHDPHLIDGDFPAYVERVSLEELFSQADAISIHWLLNDETRGLVDGRLLRLDQLGSLDSIYVVGAVNQWKRTDPEWLMTQTGLDRYELRKPLAFFAGRAEWPFKFLINGDIWVGAPASAANREVVVTDTATFNLLMINPEAGAEGDSEIMRVFRERINKAWPGQGANLALDEKKRYHFTFAALPPGIRVTDLEPLRGLPLTSLDLGETKVTDLSPLQDMNTLTRLVVSDGTFQFLTTDIMAGLRRDEYDGADRAVELAFQNFTQVPAFAAARAVLSDSVANMRTARVQPGQPLPRTAVFKGHRYAFIARPMSWPDAKNYAQQTGGYLATATSEAENQWLADTFGLAALGRKLWLGGTDENTESFWRWQNGEGWRYEHWTAPEPNNNGGSEHALAIKPDGWWIDANGYDLHLPFVVEWDQ